MENVKKLELFFSDLNEEAQKEFLEFQNCKTAADGNYDMDILPIAVLEVYKPAIQIFSIADPGNIDRMEKSGQFAYLASVGFTCIDIHHPVYQVDICEREINNQDFKVFTFSPIVIDWAKVNNIPITDYVTKSIWGDVEYGRYSKLFRNKIGYDIKIGN